MLTQGKLTALSAVMARATAGIEFTHRSILAWIEDTPPPVLGRCTRVNVEDTLRRTSVACQGQQLGIEADGLAHALEHGALEVVVEQHPGHAAEGGEGQRMAAEEAVRSGVQIKALEADAATPGALVALCALAPRLLASLLPADPAAVEVAAVTAAAQDDFCLLYTSDAADE